MDKAFLDLLKKWLSGDFRRTDGERLQSMMADDDFQREAYEGFAEQSETVDERQVSAMRARFEKKYGRKKGGRSVPMTWLMAAAACGLLVFGTIWLFQKTDEKMTASEQPISMGESVQSADNQSVATTIGDSTTAPSPIFNEKKPGDFSKKRSGASPDLPQKTVADFEKKEDFQTETIAAADENEAVRKTATESKTPPAVATAPTRSEPRNADFDQNQRAQNYQNVPPTLPSDYGANAKPMPKKSEPAAKPAAPAAEKAEQLSDVVVAAEKSKKAKTANKKADESQKPAPVTGWPAFGEYILKNKKQPVEAQLANISGTVELKFYVDRDGRPIQILVSKKIGGGCDEEAVRLLENGPNWSPGNREAKVSIDFK